VPDYFILKEAQDPTADCLLDRLPEGNDALFRPRVGKPMGADYPEVMQFEMSPDLGGIRLHDLICNTLGFYVISARLKQILEEHAGAEFEFLPIHIVNRKGRREKGPYFIANLIGRQVDCADLSRSIMRESAMRKGRYGSLRRLTIDPARVDPDFKVFRLQQMPKLFIVRDDLKGAIERGGVTGCAFHAMGTDVDID